MRILFLFVGEPHQLLHSLPIAGELATLRPDYDIEVAIVSDDHNLIMSDVLAVYPNFRPRVTVLKTPAIARLMMNLGLANSPRLATLVAAIPFLRSFDAIIVPERTTRGQYIERPQIYPKRRKACSGVAKHLFVASDIPSCPI